MPVDPISLAIGSFVLGKLGEKAIDVTADKGAKTLAKGRVGLVGQRRFKKIIDETWTAFERDREIDRLLTRSLRTILWDKSDNAQRFRAEAVKVQSPIVKWCI